MLSALPARAIAGARRVLEIGGGIGALQAELLLRGADTGEVIELLGVYEPYARRLAERLGIADRTTFRVADVIDAPEQAEAADIVLMNRVVCCSADGVRLTEVAADLARGALVLSHPRYLRVLRWAARFQEPLARLFRRRYRFYIHPRTAIHRAASSTGMSLFATWHGAFWEYSVFTRPGWGGNSALHTSDGANPIGARHVDLGGRPL